jgi:colicin import membrane protein
MLQQHFSSYLLKLIAIILVASGAIYMPARAQNNAQKAAEIADEQAERVRIKSERAQIKENLAQQREVCYQKLAVTPCLNEARDQHSQKMRDLKRQEVALNDVQRKRAAADRVKALDQRTSPEVQLKRTEDRGKAMQDSSVREESRAQRQVEREAKKSAAAKSSQASNGSKPADTSAPAPQGKPRQQPAAKVAPEQRPGQAEKMQKSREQAAQRDKQAAARRALAEEREAKIKKPPAAGLPIPAEAK